jgi:hypothetical protein
VDSCPYMVGGALNLPSVGIWRFLDPLGLLPYTARQTRHGPPRQRRRRPRALGCITGEAGSLGVMSGRIRLLVLPLSLPIRGEDLR